MWSRRSWLKWFYGTASWLGACIWGRGAAEAMPEQVPWEPHPFGDANPNLDSLATGRWWEKTPPPRQPNPPPSLVVSRDQVVAFAVYTHYQGVLKLTAQLYPLYPNESRVARLEIKQHGVWKEVAQAPVIYPGWSAHFRVTDWDQSREVPYRVRHGACAVFEGIIRAYPQKPEIVVATMSCNSSRTTGGRPEIVDKLIKQNPDLLFFAGDQTYRHTEHTAGWIEFGLQFRDVLRDRPTITIPDDHDVGHPNLWGEGGKRARRRDGADGGYFFPAAYVNMVQRQQTWHLPDPVDPRPVDQDISVYFTRFCWGGVDFAIIEDRKFKSGPEGKVPQRGPRPDHITDPAFDPQTIDLPGLELLGERQLAFLESWVNDWRGAEVKVVLSQTAFCGAVHLHGQPENRLIADLDCNGWPQSGRRAALERIRRAWACHLCGDQHLAVLVQHGIDTWRDGPFGFTNPALVNTIYGRWWHPADEQPGAHPRPDTSLPWTGDYTDGLGNKITMWAYANPQDLQDEKQRADGYGLVRFDLPGRQIRFECWPRFANIDQGDAAQFPGWPVTIPVSANDGRQVWGWLPELRFQGYPKPPVVGIHDLQRNEVLYTVRPPGMSFQPQVYHPGRYEIRVGPDRPDFPIMISEAVVDREQAGTHFVEAN